MKGFDAACGLLAIVFFGVGAAPLAGASDASVVIYVSSSGGDNANSGRSPKAAKQTLNAAYFALPDKGEAALLLKRGDVWVNESIGGRYGAPNYGVWTKAGISSTRRMVVGAYGEGEKPVVRQLGDSPQVAGMMLLSDDLSHITVRDIDFQCRRSAFADRLTGGVICYGKGTDIVLERLRVSGSASGINLHGAPGQAGERTLTNLIVRDSVLWDIFPGIENGVATDCSGMFVSGCRDVTIQRNTLWRIGWRDGWPGGEKTVRNQGMYLHGNSTNVLVEGNVVGLVSHSAIQMRGGRMVARENVVIHCPVGISAGSLTDLYSNGGVRCDAEIEDNIVTGASDLGNHPLGWGIVWEGAGAVSIRRNIVAAGRTVDPTNATALMQGTDVTGPVAIQSNALYDWNSCLLRLQTPLPAGSSVLGNAFVAPRGQAVVDSWKGAPGGLWRWNNALVSASDVVRIAWNFLSLDQLGAATGTTDWSLAYFDPATPTVAQAMDDLMRRYMVRTPTEPTVEAALAVLGESTDPETVLALARAGHDTAALLRSPWRGIFQPAPPTPPPSFSTAPADTLTTNPVESTATDARVMLLTTGTVEESPALLLTAEVVPESPPLKAKPVSRPIGSRSIRAVRTRGSAPLRTRPMWVRGVVLERPVD